MKCFSSLVVLATLASCITANSTLGKSNLSGNNSGVTEFGVPKTKIEKVKPAQILRRGCLYYYEYVKGKKWAAKFVNKCENEIRVNFCAIVETSIGIYDSCVTGYEFKTTLNLFGYVYKGMAVETDHYNKSFLHSGGSLNLTAKPSEKCIQEHSDYLSKRDQRSRSNERRYFCVAHRKPSRIRTMFFVEKPIRVIIYFAYCQKRSVIASAFCALGLPIKKLCRYGYSEKRRWVWPWLRIDSVSNGYPKSATCSLNYEDKPLNPVVGRVYTGW